MRIDLSVFISFEGGEGSGKTSQAKLLRDQLIKSGVYTILVHEPGSTPLGDYLRNWLKKEQPKHQTISHQTEALLFAAARAELVSKVIKPTLAQIRTVIITDRYSDSTIAYQGYGRGIPLDDLEPMNDLAMQGTIPDLTFLLDCSPEVSLERISPNAKLQENPQPISKKVRVDEEGTRRFEKETLKFHTRVRQGYLALAKKDPKRWRILDANKPVDKLSEIIWDIVQPLLQHPTANINTDHTDLQSRFPIA